LEGVDPSARAAVRALDHPLYLLVLPQVLDEPLDFLPLPTVERIRARAASISGRKSSFAIHSPSSLSAVSQALGVRALLRGFVSFEEEDESFVGLLRVEAT